MPGFEHAVNEIVKRDPRFSPNAYDFLREALDYTLSRIAKGNNGNLRHVNAFELLDGFRDYALERFGPMAMTVVREWGVKNGYQVGEMVYLLIEEGVFAQQEGDSINDFKGYMSFRDAFENPFLPVAR